MHAHTHTRIHVRFLCNESDSTRPANTFTEPLYTYT